MKIVATIPESYKFVSQDIEVETIKTQLGKIAAPYDAFFVQQKDGEYTSVYGMVGTVPYKSKLVLELIKER